MQVLLLVVVTALAWAVTVPAAEYLIGPGQVRPSLVAAALCLVPAAGTLVLADRVTRRAPALAPVAVLAGSGVRLAVVVVGVVLLGETLARWGESRTRFANWAAAFYLVTLAAESVLLARAARSAGPAEAP